MTKFSCSMISGSDIFYATVIAEDAKQAREMAAAETKKGRPREWSVAVLESEVDGPSSWPRRRVTAHGSGSVITPRQHPVSGSWRTPRRTRKCDAACTSCAPPWTPFVCCSKFARPSSSWSTSRIGRPSVKRRNRLHRHWRTSSRVCAQDGKRVRSARP